MNKKGIKIFLAFLLAFVMVIAPMQANLAVEDALVVESSEVEAVEEVIYEEVSTEETEVTEEVEVTEEEVIEETEVTEEVEVTEEEVIEETEVTEEVEVTEEEVTEETQVTEEETVETTPEASEFKLTVVHTNDVHGNIFVSEDTVGFGKLKTYFDAIEGNKLLLDAGDVSQGTLEVNLTKGAPAFELMNLVGYHAMTLGNHEYDFSKEQLDSNVDKAEFPVYVSNIVDESGNTPFLKGQVKEIDGVKVGIFGLDTPETKVKANPLNTEGLNFLNPIEVAKKEVESLKSDGAEIIIALVHLGNEGSTAMNERSFTLIEEVEGIDLVIDGHDHIMGQSLREHNTMYSQGIANGGGFGHVEITYNKETGEKSYEYKIVTPADLLEVEADSQIEDYIAKLQDQIGPIKDEVIAYTDEFLDGERANVRTGQTKLGQIITKAMLEASGADAVITNGGGIRASIEEGNITKDDVYTVLPFGNTVTVIEVTGQQIYDALVFATDAYPEQKGAFPHVANLSFDIIEGKGIENVLLKGEPIDLEKTYLLGTNDFMAVGGDGFEMFKGARVVTILPGMAEIVMDYMQENMPVPGTDQAEDETEIEENHEEDENVEGNTVVEDEKVEGNEIVEVTLGGNSANETTRLQDGANGGSTSSSDNPKTADAGVAVFALTAVLASGAFVSLKKRK